MSNITTQSTVDLGLSSRTYFRRWKDALIERFIQANGLIAIAAIAMIFIFLLRFSIPAFKHTSVWHFLTGRTWQPEFETFGILPLLCGSLFVTLGAVLLSVPIGIASSIYIAEVAPVRVREILKPTIEVLAGIPSVVIGFIGLTIAGPLVAAIFRLNSGLCALTGSIMLAFMAIPTIISIAEDAIVAVPKTYRDASLALGTTHWETIRNAVLPAAKSGIVAASLLGVGRAIGETMTVLMVTGQASRLPDIAKGLSGIWAYFTGGVRTMTGTIAGDMGEIVDKSQHYYTLFAIGLTLFTITFLVNLLADITLRNTRR